MSRKKTVLQQLTIDGQPETVATLDLQPSWGGRRKGAGRPKTCEFQHKVTIRVSSYTFACLKAAAAAQGSTPTALAHRAVLQSLEIQEGGPRPAELVTIY